MAETCARCGYFSCKCGHPVFERRYYKRHHSPNKEKQPVCSTCERLKSDYSLLEELSPPDIPRKQFVERLFLLWEQDCQQPPASELKAKMEGLGKIIAAQDEDITALQNDLYEANQRIEKLTDEQK